MVPNFLDGFLCIVASELFFGGSACLGVGSECDGSIFGIGIVHGNAMV